MKSKSYEKNKSKNCDVCQNEMFVDSFGNGICQNCGWHQDYDSLDFPDKVRYPNRVSFNKAKFLYKEGKPFTPTLEDFIGGLFFYSEMEFTYNGRRFGVFLRADFSIELCEGNIEDSTKYYKTKEDFMTNANVDGILLKDIWSDIENANYMSCIGWD